MMHMFLSFFLSKRQSARMIKEILVLKPVVHGRKSRFFLRTSAGHIMAYDPVSQEMRGATDHEMDKYADLFHKAKWEGQKTPTPRHHMFTIGHHVKSGTRMCSFGKHILTHCDIILGLGLVDAIGCDDVDLSFDALCERARQSWIDQSVRKLTRPYLVSKRSSYRLVHVSNEEKASAIETIVRQSNRICKNQIQLPYIRARLKSERNQLLMAQRPIYKEEKTSTLKPWSVYRSLKPTPTYKEFRDILDQKTPTQKMNYLTDLVQSATIGNVRRTKSKVKPFWLLGGYSVFREGEKTIWIIILCSHRSVGGMILKHIMSKGKKVVIKGPLPDAVPFYEKMGFVFVDEGDDMVYSPPSVVSSK